MRHKPATKKAGKDKEKWKLIMGGMNDVHLLSSIMRELEYKRKES